MAKTAFVTGGSRGIGAGIVKSLANFGFNVAFTYKSNIGSSRELVNSLESLPNKIISIEMDLSDRASIDSALSSARQNFSSIDILVNNAAVAQEKPFELITDEDWENMLKINLQAPFMITQSLLPDMIKRKWGRVINISSIGGQWGGLNQVHYAAAKAGLINFSRSIAKIYSKYNITSNAIAPGLIETEMSSPELKTAAGKDKLKNIPANRIGNVEEVGDLVAYLASDSAGYVTGQTINLNGGMYFST